MANHKKWKRALEEDLSHKYKDEDKFTEYQEIEQSKNSAAMDYLTRGLEDNAFNW
jgi:hypothetical protein